MTYSQSGDENSQPRWTAPPPSLSQPHWTAPTPPPRAGGIWVYAPLLYAPWRRRVLAFLIDAVIAIIVGVVFRSVFRTPDAAPYGELVATALLQWMQSRTGATFGKRVVGLRLVDLKDGTAPTFATCICRWLLHLLDAILFIGFLAPIVTARKQTLADMIAKTVVIVA